ncbi:MAG: hypothetical protein C6Y22_11215 [Hapalosiphonaceae cyanobacterium JJU2]|nr:MAG: hypothetical protein C6Y22_11215 [Hapalosiphonaceae cyanobacterium JJU2]
MLQTRLEVSTYLQNLLEVVASLSRVKPKAVEALSQTLLAIPPDGQGVRGGKSGLNSDGSPLQVCLTATSKHLYSRLLSDPGFVLADPKERFEASRQALAEVLQLTASQQLAILCDRTLRWYLPKDVVGFSRFTSGVLWLGAGIDTPGCAMYIDARRNGNFQEAWDWAQQWLADILPNSREASSAIAALRNYAYLQSIGIEGSNLNNARAKLYWRFLRPTRLDQMGLEIFQNPALASFLTFVIKDSTLQLSGIVPSLGFAITTGESHDAKIDVCGHCLPYSTSKWVELVNCCTQMYDLTNIPVREALAQNCSSVSYLGMGCDRNDALRLNLYLKATAKI